jgi:hypothetical protein
MKKVSSKQLRKWGKAYQKGKPMPLRAEFEELNSIIEDIDKLLKAWEKNHKKDMSFGNFLGIHRGMWEATYGFYRPWREDD